jgi:hypothetical protein
MKRRWLVSLGLILLFAMLVSPIFTNFVREVIVIPLLYLLWIGRFLFEALPQAVIWAGFFFMLLLIMGISLLGRNRSTPRSRHTVAVPQARIAAWLDLLQKAERDTYFRWRLAQRLQRLVLDIFAYRADQSLRQTRQQLKQGELAIPPELQAYFQASLQPLGYLSRPKRPFAAKAAPSPLDLDPAQVVQFLESLEAETVQIPSKERQ